MNAPSPAAPAAAGCDPFLRERIAQVLAAIRERRFRGPFWIGKAGHYVIAHRRSGVRLWRAVPHLANPLSPLSPVIRNAAYAHNQLCREWTSRGPEAEVDLCRALAEALEGSGGAPCAPGQQPTPAAQSA